jgi:hypothetical protein
MVYKRHFCFVLLLISIFIGYCSAPKKSTTPIAEMENTITIPLGGNAFITKSNANSTAQINTTGLHNWTNKTTEITTYFKVADTGDLAIALIAKAPENSSSKIKILVDGIPFLVTIDKTVYSKYYVGNIFIKKAGYIKLVLQGLEKNGAYFADVADLVIGGTSTKSKVYFANDTANFYWSRRGPSCHLNYIVPKVDIAYFYSEISVPNGADKIGSYFMANGFKEGYFGIQVNSATERRILFSVWEDDENNKTILLKKGNNVKDGRFDGEGTGGQSYMLYNWKPDVTYKFLTNAKPDGNGNTIFTSWFYAPEMENWQLMASFKKQNTNNYLKHLYSFVENFLDDNGYLERKAYYGNQWIQLTNGSWKEINECTFSVDATGINLQRMDYNGGVENGYFFLQNGGFFNATMEVGKKFKRALLEKAPEINLLNLP